MNAKINLSDIRIRKELRPGDLGYIAYLHGTVYAKELHYGLNFEAYVLGGLQEFANQYNPEKDRIWICEHEDKIIGFLVGFQRGDSVQLRYFVFLPEYRGIGLGKKLMKEFMDYMRTYGYKKAYLWTTNQQDTAISLYERFGFTLSEEKQSQTFDVLLTELRYDIVLP